MKYLKRKILLLTMCTMPFAGLSYAEEGDLYVAVGIKAWQNSWSTWNARGADVVPESSKTAIIPSISVLMGNWVLSGGYMSASGYELNSGSGSLWQADRTEQDVSLGYRFGKITLLAGYKGIEQSVVFSTGSVAKNFSYKGPIVGIASSGAINSWLHLYGNFSYGSMVYTSPTGKSDSRAEYTSSELGFSASFGSGFSGTLGYKNQTLDTTRPSGTLVQDITSGAITSITWVF